MEKKAFQDLLPDEISHCYGCGRNNQNGLQIKSYWDGEKTVCNWIPQEQFMAGKNFLCGGIIATLIDCHGLNTAIAVAYKEEGREIGSKPFIPYATGSISIKLLCPNPLNHEIMIRGQVKSINLSKIIVLCRLYSNEKECAQGEITAVKVSENFWK